MNPAPRAAVAASAPRTRAGSLDCRSSSTRRSQSTAGPTGARSSSPKRGRPPSMNRASCGSGSRISTEPGRSTAVFCWTRSGPPSVVSAAPDASPRRPTTSNGTRILLETRGFRASSTIHPHPAATSTSGPPVHPVVLGPPVIGSAARWSTTAANAQPKIATAAPGNICEDQAVRRAATAASTNNAPTWLGDDPSGLKANSQAPAGTSLTRAPSPCNNIWGCRSSTTGHGSRHATDSSATATSPATRRRLRKPSSGKTTKASMASKTNARCSNGAKAPSTARPNAVRHAIHSHCPSDRMITDAIPASSKGTRMCATTTSKRPCPAESDAAGNKA